MAGKVAAPGTAVLLVTANVGSLFDDVSAPRRRQAPTPSPGPPTLTPGSQTPSPGPWTLNLQTSRPQTLILVPRTPDSCPDSQVWEPRPLDPQARDLKTWALNPEPHPPAADP